MTCKSPPPRAHSAPASLALTALLGLGIAAPAPLPAATGSTAASAQAAIKPNYKDADIRQVIEAVGAVTGRNFIIDPRVKAQVTMVSSAPMSPDAFYAAFLSILEVYGYIAVPAGNVIKILPDANARQQPGAESATGRPQSDDIVTEIIPVENVAAAALVPILRPLIPQYGHLAAHVPTNLLIISDRAANVDRMVRIIRRIDKENSQDIEIIRLEHASATEIVKVVTALNQAAKTEGAPPPATVVADERTNSVLISGDQNDRLRLRALVAHLDTPLDEGGDTRVRYLRYAVAKDLVKNLQSQFQKQAQPGAAGQAQPPTEKGELNIWAEESTNALVITAPPKLMRSINAVIDKVDIRRLQVLVEALVVEVSTDKASELGINWAAYNANTLVGATKFALPITAGGGIPGLAGAILNKGGTGSTTTNPTAVLGTGLNVGVGRIADSGTSFVALVNALASDANTNIVGTPVLVTLDNEEAKIQVGQEIPFVTGQFTNTGATSGSTSVNPFQTIQRQQVGLTLKLTPQINEGDAILLKIENELSSVAPTSQAVDLTTNKRTINTSVIVEDGGTLVLGGLIQDDLQDKQQRVPVLGSIPLIGQLFRVDSTTKKKTNLMVFIRPTILRDDAQAAFETDAKYTYVRNQQLAVRPKQVPLMPNEVRPVLPPLPGRGAPPAIDLRPLKTEPKADGKTDGKKDGDAGKKPE